MGARRAAHAVQQVSDGGEAGRAKCALQWRGPAGGSDAQRYDRGDKAAERNGNRADEEPAETRVARQRRGAGGEGERGNCHEDDEAHRAVQHEREKAAGPARGGIAHEIEHASGITANASEEEGIVELTDPRDDVGPVEGERDPLRAEEQPPAPRVDGIGDARKEDGRDGERQGEVTAESGELPPINLADEGGEERERDDVARDSAEGTGEEKGEAAHRRQIAAGA